MTAFYSVASRALRRLAGHRTLLTLLAAAAFGVLAVTGARGYIAERLAIENERLNPRRPMVEIVVAKRDLPSGAAVDAETMAVRQVPAEFAPGGAIRPESFEHIAGARLGQPMRSGEPLMPAVLEQGRDGSFSTRIRQGIRAMTIQVDEVNSVSGMLQPGDRIDLMFTVRPPTVPGTPPADEVTAPLMQDLPVLATGSQVVASGEPAGVGRPFTSITVEVSPEQAQRLIVAQRSGRLTATLRHPDDRTPVRATALDVGTMLGLRRAVAPVPVRRSPGPEIIVGGRGGPLRAVEASGEAASPGASASKSPAPVAVAAPPGVAAPPAGAVPPSTAVPPIGAATTAQPTVISGLQPGDAR